MTKERNLNFKKIYLSTFGLIILLVILVLGNLILSFANVRWDTTEDKIYSLSKGTRNILSEMSVPVDIKFFYSQSHRDFPAGLKIYARRVEDFLSEYENESGGKIKLEVIDPKVDSDEEDWAQRYGIRPLTGPSGENLYCGLVFLAEDREEKIELLDPSREELLEYDLTQAIFRLQSPKKKTIGIISSLPVMGGPANMPVPGQPQGLPPFFFISELKKAYDVRDLGLSAEKIDDSIDLLMIIHPKGISPKTEYAIDQYVLKGGNALIFVDPLCVSDRSRGQQQFMQMPSSNLEKLFKAWGVTMDPAKALVDMNQPTRVRGRDGTAEDNPMWISARGEAFDSADIVTSQLENMLFPIAGALKKSEGSGHEFIPLVQSSDRSSLVNAFMAQLGAEGVRKNFVSANEKFNIAVRIRGKFTSAFPEGPPPADGSGAKEQDNKGHLTVGQKNATLIIVADADMLTDQFYVQRSNFLGFNMARVFNDNLNFLSNAVEILLGSDDLIGLRSRGKFERPFTAVLELKQKAQERWLAKENELIKEEEITNRKLQELQQQKSDSSNLILSQDQEAEIIKFKKKRLDIKQELKQVRRNLRADIERLGNILKVINIFLMPVCVAIAGIGFAIYRQRRMKTK